jgi:riboflavin synthase
MFTGIVEETGRILEIRADTHRVRLAIAATTCAMGTRVGDSIAVNGCCLTVVRRRSSRRGAALEFDLLNETWNRTGFSRLAENSLVNLERALPSDGRLGGHFVTGHIDGTGVISKFGPVGPDHLLEVLAPQSVLRLVAMKGSIAVDGVSLTVAKVTARNFRVWLIPHTLSVTSFRERKVSDLVNLETDLLAKHVERLMQSLARLSRAQTIKK